jgi:hypothetical protein
VGLLFGENPTTVPRRVSRFEGSGLKGLREGKHSRRPRQLLPAQWRYGGKSVLACAAAPHCFSRPCVLVYQYTWKQMN